MSTEKNENLTNQDWNGFDDDDHHLNAPHKIVPTVSKPTLSETNEQDNQTSAEAPVSTINQLDNSNVDVQNLMKNDLKIYVNTLIPKDYSGFVQCHVKFEKVGLTETFSTIYTLYFDGQNENDQTFLLIARSHLTVGGHLEFFIGTNSEDPSNLNDENSIAKLGGINITGTDYILYDHQDPSNKQKQSAAIIYDEHIFGSKEPRKFMILLSNNENNSEPLKENETIIDEWKSGRSNNLIQLKNKAPTYNEESETYVINLYGDRVKQPSHKNFQIITSDEDQENNVAMQFGRIDENSFVLDYRYPLTAIQAFAIGLSSFHNRFRT